MPLSRFVRPPQIPPSLSRFLEGGRAWVLRHGALAASSAFLLVFGILYLRCAHRIDQRLAAGPFSASINIYTAPRVVAVGDPLTPEEVVARLRRGGYSPSRGNPVGWYTTRPRAVEIFPGPEAGAQEEPGVLEFRGGRISRIVSLDDNTERREFPLGPALIANFSAGRERRCLIRYSDIPPALVDAVISAEDKHFFHHSGFDLVRAVKAAYVDLKDGRKEQGASTLTMQLARGLWLEPDKSWRRKFQEAIITMHLEFRLSKQQIFEDYANQVYLGRSGTYSIDGFGEASRAYFGKGVSELTVPEAALLAGMVQRPSYFNPYRNPGRARERRNLVLQQMRDNGYLTPAQCQRAMAAPVKVVAGPTDSTQAQYFVDLVNDELQKDLRSSEKKVRYVYTTLDPDLQEAAEQSVAGGMRLVDSQLRGSKHGRPQVALIALDPHTGAIRALVGGRNYTSSQLNHVLAMRQPGSVFKPFVYAAALDTAVNGGSPIFTPSSMVDDAPSTFYFGNQVYRPANFRNEYMGRVTLRTALAHSLNNATIELARQVGYGRVADMARICGLNADIRPTPAMAIGAYETTPLDIAGAYTVFGNSGQRVTPTTLSLARDGRGSVLWRQVPDPRQALDPRVNYLLVNMLQDVLQYGTGRGVRARGFELPAAGKTGTSRDGWFAGFTSQLLCIVWVGFDDGHDLGLEGARSALPIWTEFMKRAARHRPYGDVSGFEPPEGVVTASACAGSDCSDDRHPEPYIEGTERPAPRQLHAVKEPPSSGPSEADRDQDAAPADAAKSPAPDGPAAAPEEPAAPAPASAQPATVPPAGPTAKPASEPPAAQPATVAPAPKAIDPPG